MLVTPLYLEMLDAVKLLDNRGVFDARLKRLQGMVRQVAKLDDDRPAGLKKNPAGQQPRGTAYDAQVAIALTAL